MHVRPRVAAGHASDRASGVSRRELIVAVAIAWVLVIARSAVFLGYEQSFFDSDQAIIGLMAKHLVEGRAFPLFFYGQPFLLGVQAWIAAPFFLLAGPTVAALRMSVIATNLGVATLLVVGLSRWGGLRPLMAIVPALFFLVSTPYTTVWLIEAGAASICPFLWVLLLWTLRDRPLWFGPVMALGFLNREFTIYALPVIWLGELWSRRLFTAERARMWVIASVAALGTWQGIQSLKPHADLMGPGTRGQLLHGFDGSQIDNLSDRMSLAPGEWPGRTSILVQEHLPVLLGARRMDRSTGRQGYDWLRWPLLCGLALMLLRASFLAVRYKGFNGSAFGWYVTGVGLVAAGMYVATRPAGELVDRYLLLAVLIPVGATAVHLAVEPLRLLRVATLALVCLWTVLAGRDHAALVARYWHEGESHELRMLIDGLVERRIAVAEAGYWRAYKITFLAAERVKVASTDVVRVDEYQRLATEAGPALVAIRDTPCPGGELVVDWYLCRQHP